MQLDWMTRRALCTGETVNTIRRLRSAAPPVPDADTAEQRGLEAAFLRSWIEAADEEFLAGRGLVPFVAATHPFAGHLSMSVHDPALLGPVLSRLLPLGVGAHLGRDFLELRFRGSRIRLCGISRERGRDVLAAIPRARAGGLSFTRWDSVLSALLRRLQLWRGAKQFALFPAENAVVVHWVGEPGLVDVVHTLGSPSCGIPHFTWGSSSLGVIQELLVDDSGTFAHFWREEWEAWCAVRAVHAAQPRRVPVVPRSRTVLPLGTWDSDGMYQAIWACDAGRIYQLLRAKGVSLRHIAAMVGQSYAEVSRIAEAAHEVVPIEAMRRIGARLGIPESFIGSSALLILARLGKHKTVKRDFVLKDADASARGWAR